MPETRIVRVANGFSPEDVRPASECLRNGGLVVFPTETVYGLGANALSEKAVSGIFRVKGRPADNPLIVHISGYDQLSDVVDSVPDTAEKLMKRFWPGPLSLVMVKSRLIPGNVTGGLETVSVRMPSGRLAQTLISQSGVPVAAPSANLSGRPSITDAAQAVGELSGLVDFIIDGGRSEIGLESTVLDVTGDIPRILRPGAVTAEQLKALIGDVVIHPAVMHSAPVEGPAPSPGMKHRHYAPARAVLLLVDPGEDTDERIDGMLRMIRRMGLRGCAMVSDECAITGRNVFRIGSRKDLATVGSNLFRTIREADAAGFDVIVAEGYGDNGIGLAVMNRLRRASVTFDEFLKIRAGKNQEASCRKAP
jgi:L-threonylcarbamoyladenylate synthase